MSSLCFFSLKIQPSITLWSKVKAVEGLYNVFIPKAIKRNSPNITYPILIIGNRLLFALVEGNYLSLPTHYINIYIVRKCSMFTSRYDSDTHSTGIDYTLDDTGSNSSYGQYSAHLFSGHAQKIICKLVT